MRAQGSLEYMVIIAVILAISGIVILYTSGILGTQKSAVSISLCKQTAEKCKLSKMTSPTDPCNACIAACANYTFTCWGSPAAKSISKGAIGCCKNGKSDQIYFGSPGCGTVLDMKVGWNYFEVPFDWESTTAFDLSKAYPLIYIISYFDSNGKGYSYVPSVYKPEYSFDICPGMQIWLYTYTTFDISG